MVVGVVGVMMMMMMMMMLMMMMMMMMTPAGGGGGGSFIDPSGQETVRAIYFPDGGPSDGKVTITKLQVRWSAWWWR
jgi:ABC-type glycerol-3-phosphate transport system substrate-binding protein